MFETAQSFLLGLTQIFTVTTFGLMLLGIAIGFALSLLTYFVVVSPLQRTRKIREEEKEIFILTATLLWGIMIQEALRKAALDTDGACAALGSRLGGLATEEAKQRLDRYGPNVLERARENVKDHAARCSSLVPIRRSAPRTSPTARSARRA